MGTAATQDDLYRIMGQLAGCQGLQQFGRVLDEAICRLIPCDVVALYLYSEQAQSFAPVSDLLKSPESPGYFLGQLPAAGTLKEAAVRQQRAVMENDLAHSPWGEQHVLAHTDFPTASSIAVPLTLCTGVGTATEARRTIAVMGAIAIGRSQAFTEAHRQWMEQLGAHLGPVLQSVLGAEERDALMTIGRQVMVGSMTIEALMPIVRTVLHQVMQQDMIGLHRFMDGAAGPYVDTAYLEGASLDEATVRALPFEHTAPAELLKTGKPLLLTGHDTTAFRARDYLASLGILSAILCPLIVRETPYGFLSLGSRRRNAFSERDLAFAEQIGFHVSQAIANLTAYDEIRRLNEQLAQENVYLRDEITASADLTTLVGESAALQRTLKAIEQVAPTDTTVLITGETGTGKDLVAHAIHQLSPRKARPFIVVNCAALPPTLIESELFGHEKGAFTSATARKLGRFELAEGGTIFLDEIADVPVELQAKLLRVLESQDIQRVGGTTTKHLNVRVLTATNADLAQAVAEKRFRSDLYYRLNVFPIRLPPLRERREDIPALVRHFVQKYGQRHRRQIGRIPTAALKTLAAYDWPGNVRELAHVIERAVIVSQGPALQLDPILPTADASPPQAPAHTLADAERAHILDTLTKTGWVLAGKHGAAARLGMKRSTLQHRMRKLGIRRPTV